MAYDLARRKHIRRNIALSSSLTTNDVVSDPTVTTDEDKAYLAQLAVIKMNADAGNAKAKKDWLAAQKNIAKIVAKAKKGDKAAQHTVAVIRESGLFQGVAAMDVSGSDDFSPQEKKLIAAMTNLRVKAAKGNPAAIRLCQAIGLEFEGISKL